jgi:hypothetical protein
LNSDANVDDSSDGDSLGEVLGTALETELGTGLGAEVKVWASARRKFAAKSSPANDIFMLSFRC